MNSRPVCKCGNLCKPNGLNSKGLPKYNTYCRSCSKAKHGKQERLYRIMKKSFCESCGFIAIHKCQLDLDHIDGNHKNDSPDNLQTLCANCHRLKTFINKDWIT